MHAWQPHGSQLIFAKRDVSQTVCTDVSYYPLDVLQGKVGLVVAAVVHMIVFVQEGLFGVLSARCWSVMTSRVHVVCPALHPSHTTICRDVGWAVAWRNAVHRSFLRAQCSRSRHVCLPAPATLLSRHPRRRRWAFPRSFRLDPRRHHLVRGRGWSRNNCRGSSIALVCVCFLRCPRWCRRCQAGSGTPCLKNPGLPRRSGRVVLAFQPAKTERFLPSYFCLLVLLFHWSSQS